ncbi:tetratricopeptide repeat protein [Methermicoccus shengliensis]|uniref:Tetratricopeptide repeat protein n=1 Tax=Methermicoccus shengliensis TaxID=660064 RepID=A0A832RUG8_9EURY|nr:tetratricopeptide repeat protein [Methermicoccus shengliensis]HIH69517.1 tetratricopeptide repeat protein [Methermicoccus shengliensis]
MRAWVVAAMAVLMCVHVVAISAMAQPSSVDELLKEAGSKYYLGEYAEAKEIYLKVLELDERNVFALYGVANCLYALESYAEAIEYYERALDVQPDNVVLLNNIANAYYALKRYEDAIAYYERALRVDPANEVVLENLANAQYAAGDYEGADATLKKLERVRLPTYILTARTLMERGNYTGAIQYYQRALDVEPENISLLVELSYAQYRSGSLEDALATHAKALERMERARGYSGALSLSDDSGRVVRLAEVGIPYTLRLALEPGPDARAGYVYVKIYGSEDSEDTPAVWVDGRPYYAPIILRSDERAGPRVVFTQAGTYTFQLNEADAQYVVQVLDPARMSELASQRAMSTYVGGLLLMAGIGVVLLGFIAYRLGRGMGR